MGSQHDYSTPSALGGGEDVREERVYFLERALKEKDSEIRDMTIKLKHLEEMLDAGKETRVLLAKHLNHGMGHSDSPRSNEDRPDRRHGKCGCFGEALDTSSPEWDSGVGRTGGQVRDSAGSNLESDSSATETPRTSRRGKSVGGRDELKSSKRRSRASKSLDLVHGGNPHTIAKEDGNSGDESLRRTYSGQDDFALLISAKDAEIANLKAALEQVTSVRSGIETESILRELPKLRERNVHLRRYVDLANQLLGENKMLEDVLDTLQAVPDIHIELKKTVGRLKKIGEANEALEKEVQGLTDLQTRNSFLHEQVTLRRNLERENELMDAQIARLPELQEQRLQIRQKCEALRQLEDENQQYELVCKKLQAAHAINCQLNEAKRQLEEVEFENRIVSSYSGRVDLLHMSMQPNQAGASITMEGAGKHVGNQLGDDENDRSDLDDEVANISYSANRQMSELEGRRRAFSTGD